ncbi:MAG: 30S ribosomal protein S5 [Candidatus Micrarchaeota archaeon]
MAQKKNRERKARRERRFREAEPKPEWIPKTEIGKRVKNKEILSLEEIFELGKPILEYEIVDELIPDLKEETLCVSVTQRMTDCGRKTQFKAVALVGDCKGHVGIGVGKADETRPAISTAVKNAKRNVISVPLGCGSWECGCKEKHTIPINTVGKNGSIEITLKPAPRGVGIVANEVVRKVLTMAGVKDIWSFSRGRTHVIYNSSMAVYNALNGLNKMKYRGDLGAMQEKSA